MSTPDFDSTIRNIVVTTAMLHDNGGSVVDAKMEGGILYLNKDAWKAIFKSGDLEYELVFHETLRLSRYNDDDYRISAPLAHLNVAELRSSNLPFIKLRKMFAAAHVPARDELVYATTSNSHDSEYEDCLAEATRAQIGEGRDFMHSGYQFYKYSESMTKMGDLILAYEQGMLSGVDYNGTIHSVRVTNTGDLMVETLWGHEVPSYLPRIPSIAFPEQFVSHYNFCRKPVR